MVRIGIVGSGFMATTHVRAYESIDAAEVVAVASPNTAGEFVSEEQLDSHTYESASEMMDGETLDAVDICSPTPTHRPIVQMAADRGLDVFCEKPIAGSITDARAIADAVSTADVSCMVGHVLRFFPGYQRMREVICDGGIGEPGVAQARRLSEFPSWGHSDWYRDRDQSGGVLLDLAIHDIDMCRWVVGEVERVFARRSVWEDGEHAHVMLRFVNGSVGYVEGSWGLPSGHEVTHSFELAGDDGIVSHEGDAAAVTKRTADGTETASPVAQDGYERQLTAFVESVQSGTVPPVTLEDAIDTLRVSLAAIRSARSGRPVTVSEVDA